MTAPDDIDSLAAEYVLGTLTAGERAAVAARRGSDPVLSDAIRAWELRMGPLADTVQPVTPPADLFRRIERHLTAPTQAPDPAIVDLTRRMRRWRRVAMAASALAASLALAIGLRETVLAPPAQTFVAVFQKDDALPAFMLSIDLASRQLTIRPVAAEPQAGKTYQLWIASEQLGPAPRSLGLLDEAKAPTSKSLAAFDPNLLRRATFGVSVEPPGGSPTGRPSGTPLHAKLYPAVP